jgi:chaperone required for assembly of F1-ATPase
MSEWKAKRFWKRSTIEKVGNCWYVKLDERILKTPAKADMVLPSRALAEAVAVEWEAQQELIDPLSMPFTSTANAAIDKVAVQTVEVANMLASYGDADLLCYRAEGPSALTSRQASVWDPYIEWAADALGARLHPRIGLMHLAQDEIALNVLSKLTHSLSAYELASFHDLVSLSGSLVLGFATIHDYATPDDIWAASRLDEIWQEEQWGADELAQEAANIKKASYIHAKSFFDAIHAL